MKKIEYKTIHQSSFRNDGNDTLLNKLGSEGWDMVLFDTENYNFIFQRDAHNTPAGEEEYDECKCTTKYILTGTGEQGIIHQKGCVLKQDPIDVSLLLDEARSIYHTKGWGKTEDERFEEIISIIKRATLPKN